MFLPETTRCIGHVSQRAVSEAVTYCCPVGTLNAMPADQGIFVVRMSSGKVSSLENQTRIHPEYQAVQELPICVAREAVKAVVEWKRCASIIYYNVDDLVAPQADQQIMRRKRPRREISNIFTLESTSQDVDLIRPMSFLGSRCLCKAGELDRLSRCKNTLTPPSSTTSPVPQQAPSSHSASPSSCPPKRHTQETSPRNPSTSSSPLKMNPRNPSHRMNTRSATEHRSPTNYSLSRSAVSSTPVTSSISSVYRFTTPGRASGCVCVCGA